MIFSPLRSEIEQLLAGLAKGEPRLADAADFQRTVEEHGPASMFVHARVGAALEQGWHLARVPLQGLIRQMGAEGPPADVVPTSEQMAKAFGDLSIAGIADEHGFHLRQKHPLGLGVMLAFGGWGAQWFLNKASQRID